MLRTILAALLLAAMSTAFASANASAIKPELVSSGSPKFRSYNKEIECLTAAIYFEARGEPIIGQNMVAQVVLNRVESAYYPDTVCDVVYQNAHRKNACQFSFACDDLPDRFDEGPAHLMARKIATMQGVTKRIGALNPLSRRLRHAIVVNEAPQNRQGWQPHLLFHCVDVSISLASSVLGERPALRIGAQLSFAVAALGATGQAMVGVLPDR
jgi:hypothetical protein